VEIGVIVYKVTNKVNGKIYIGKTIYSLKERMRCHLKSKAGIFSKALRKYGMQSFDFKIIDIAKRNETLLEKEKYWIKYYRSKVPNGYNLTDGGEGMCGYCLSEETKQKISKSQIGLQAGEKNPMYGIRLSGKKNHNYGKITPIKVKEKISKSLLGKYKGKESSNYGKPKSLITRQKISMAKKGKYIGKDSPNYGKPRSEETKQKISKGLKKCYLEKKMKELYEKHL